MMKNGNDEKIKQEDDFSIRLEFYFFDPAKTHQEYKSTYLEKYDEDHLNKYGGVKYSTLYLLREDMAFCLGQNLGSEKKVEIKGLGPANFASIALMNIAINTVVKSFFGGCDYNRFGREYMGIKQGWQLKALRNLRNALDHNQYGLSNRCKECSVKTYYNLSNQFDELVSIDKKWNRDYPSIRYKVNPRKLYSCLESGIKKLHTEVKDNSDDSLAKKFMDNVRVKDWLLLGDN